MVVQLCHELLSEVDDVHLVRVFRFQQVVIDEVGLVQVRLELVKFLLGANRPLVSINEKTVRHTLHFTDLVLDELQVCLEDPLSLLLLNLQHGFELGELLFQ